LIFSIPRLIEHLSAVLPLMPGDVIFTGTPAGIGGARKPPRFLKDGDIVETTVEGIGNLRQVCVDASGLRPQLRTWKRLNTPSTTTEVFVKTR
jgi:2-keto-4-pentenoate hydratase/2-oxohepta-3-ene-1,7-dioic acid hydratase in catechol pathway